MPEFLGINYLMPFIAAALRLSNIQSWILVSVVFGSLLRFLAICRVVLTDQLGKRKKGPDMRLARVFHFRLFYPGLANSFRRATRSTISHGIPGGANSSTCTINCCPGRCQLKRRAMNMGKL